MFNKFLGYNLLITPRVQFIARVLFVPFDPTSSHTLKPNWAGPKG